MSNECERPKQKDWNFYYTSWIDSDSGDEMGTIMSVWAEYRLIGEEAKCGKVMLDSAVMYGGIDVALKQVMKDIMTGDILAIYKTDIDHREVRALVEYAKSRCLNYVVYKGKQGEVVETSVKNKDLLPGETLSHMLW